jgi:peptide/nickel transport system permease protein
MVAAIARRGGQLLVTLLGVSVLIFLLVRFLPGDVVSILAGSDTGSDPAVRERIREQLGLSDPLPVQYFNWMGGVLTGDFGDSVRSGRPVAETIAAAFPITLELVLLGTLISIIIGVPLGVLSAARPGGPVDYAARIFGMVGISLPSFWLATLVLLFTSTVFAWTPSPAFINPFTDPLGNLTQMILPALCVGLYLTAMLMRMQRATMLEVLGEDYIRTARAKGVPEGAVIARHAWRNAALPVVTLTAFEIGVLLGGTALIEVVFSMPGLSNTLVQAIFNRDYPMIQSVTLLLAVAFVSLNLLADLIYRFIDPRVKTG